MIKGLTNKQLELQKKFWVEFKINERWKLYLETNESYNDFIRWEKIKEVNDEYDRKIQEYFSEYPEEMKKRFEARVGKAQKIIDWKSDKFINKLAKEKWLSDKEYAKSINWWLSNKSEEFILQCKLRKRKDLQNIL